MGHNLEIKMGGGGGHVPWVPPASYAYGCVVCVCVVCVVWVCGVCVCGVCGCVGVGVCVCMCVCVCV